MSAQNDAVSALQSSLAQGTRIRRLIQGGGRRALRAINRGPLAFTERLGQQHNAALEESPPIFILGSPRSGSTLLMQILVHGLEVSYLTNYHKYCFGNPSLLEFRRSRETEHRFEFNSLFGSTDHANGPWEGGEWWYRFFPRSPHFVDGSSAFMVDDAGLKRSVANWTKRSSRSLLFKNLYASLRLRYLTRLFPSARYIHITRSEREQAQSILAMRKVLLGSYEPWSSMQPPGWELVVSEDPVTQVLYQIRKTNETIQDDLAAHGVPESNIFQINYEDLCTNTHSTVKRLQGFASGFGVESRSLERIPTQFTQGTPHQTPSELLALLDDSL